MARELKLSGKKALVTGASRGIGRGIAEAFALEGADVVLVSRDQDALDTAASEIEALGFGRALPFACHVGDSEAIASLFAALDKEFGPLDILVNNAATNPYFGPMIDVDAGSWAKTFEVNLWGAFELTRHFVDAGPKRGRSGSIINLTSVLGVQASPLMGVYGMTKAAIISMTKTLAVELGPQGIRVNAIAPGLVETRFAEKLIGNPEWSDRFIQRTALGRHAQVADLAGPAVFLASDASCYVSGHVLHVDGGYSVS